MVRNTRPFLTVFCALFRNWPMIKDFLKRQIKSLKNYFVGDLVNALDTTLILQGRRASVINNRIEKINSLADVEFKIYSQWGEDGIIEWLIHKLPISSKIFIEFGVENYKEANTRFLIKNHNWKGLVIDSNEKHIRRIRNDDLYWRYDLTALHAFITRDNINSTITNSGFSGKIGILSIDIDGNDYYIWEAIDAVKPDIVVCEYNAVFGDIYPITIPYY